MSEFNCPCPACGQTIICDTAHVGKQTTCPVCHAAIVVPQATAAAPRTSGLAVASLICSIATLLTCVGWLPAIICGHMARSRMRRDSSLKGKGLATAGLTIGYLFLMLEAGTAAVYIWSFSSAMKQGIEKAKQELATNAIVVVQTQSTAPTNASQPVETAQLVTANSQPVESTVTGWTADINQMSFPTQPVSGRLHGSDFAVSTASIQGTSLRLYSESGMAVHILGLDTAVEGQSYDIQPADNGAKLRVRMSWSEAGADQTTTFGKGYAMKLQFGPAINRKIAGKIYLCLPDDSKSYVAGTFEVRVPRPPARPKAAQTN